MFKKLFVVNKINIFFVAILLINLLTGAVVLAKIDNSMSKQMADTKEEQRPANLDITIINNSDCKECFDAKLILSAIEKNNVNILSKKSLEYNDQETQALIRENNIKIIPAIIIRGELAKDTTTQKLLAQLGDINGDVFVSTKIPPPYFALNSKEIVGKVSMVMLTDDSCVECYDVSKHKDIMKNFGVYISAEEKLSIQTSRGSQLMSQYNIELLPTIILTGDIEMYTSLTSVWAKVGTKEADGVFILRDGVKGMGVYKDVSINTIIDPQAQVKK